MFFSLDFCRHFHAYYFLIIFGIFCPKIMSHIYCISGNLKKNLWINIKIRTLVITDLRTPSDYNWLSFIKINFKSNKLIGNFKN